MGAVMILFLMSLAGAVAPMKSWSDWLSEGMQLPNAGSYSANTRAIRESRRIFSSEVQEMKILLVALPAIALCAATAVLTIDEINGASHGRTR